MASLQGARDDAEKEQARKEIELILEDAKRSGKESNIENLPPVSSIGIQPQQSWDTAHPYQLYIGTLKSDRLWLALGAESFGQSPNLIFATQSGNAKLKTVAVEQLEDAELFEPFRRLWKGAASAPNSSRNDHKTLYSRKRRVMKGMGYWYFLNNIAERGGQLPVTEAVRKYILEALKFVGTERFSETSSSSRTGTGQQGTSGRQTKDTTGIQEKRAAKSNGIEMRKNKRSRDESMQYTELQEKQSRGLKKRAGNPAREGLAFNKPLAMRSTELDESDTENAHENDRRADPGFGPSAQETTPQRKQLSQALPELERRSADCTTTMHLPPIGGAIVGNSDTNTLRAGNPREARPTSYISRARVEEQTTEDDDLMLIHAQPVPRAEVLGPTKGIPTTISSSLPHDFQQYGNLTGTFGVAPLGSRPTQSAQPPPNEMQRYSSQDFSAAQNNDKNLHSVHMTPLEGHQSQARPSGILLGQRSIPNASSLPSSGNFSRAMIMSKMNLSMDQEVAFRRELEDLKKKEMALEKNIQAQQRELGDVKKREIGLEQNIQAQREWRDRVLKAL